MLWCLGAEEALKWVLFISELKPDRGRDEERGRKGETEEEGEGKGEERQREASETLGRQGIKLRETWSP